MDRGSKLGTLISLFVVALLFRLAVAALSPGTGDSRNFIASGRVALQGGNVYAYHGSYNYPPTYAAILAGTFALTDRVNIPETIAVKLPPIIADSLIALLILAIASRWHPRAARPLAWLYALNPITITIAAHHGHFDSLAYLPAVVAIFLQSAGYPFWLGAIGLGIGGALKIAPAFTGLAWFADVRGARQWIIFAAIVGAFVGGALWIGYTSAPRAFTETVLQHRRVVDGGWGFYFPILLLEWFAKRLALVGILDAAQFLRGLHQWILIAGLLLTAYASRARSFPERVLLVQLALPVFAGRMPAEYVAWLAPVFVLSNQRGLVIWGIATALWMIPIYVAFAIPPGAPQDAWLRAVTLFSVPYWLINALWYWSNLRAPSSRWLHWLTQPLRDA